MSCPYCKRNFYYTGICYQDLYFCSTKCMTDYRKEIEDRANAKRIADAENLIAEAEYEKAYAIKEQTEFLKFQYEEKKRKEQIDAFKDKCKLVYPASDGKGKYRAANLPFDDFEIECQGELNKENGEVTVTVKKLLNKTTHSTGSLRLGITEFGTANINCDFLSVVEKDDWGFKYYDSDELISGNDKNFLKNLGPLEAGECISNKKYTFPLDPILLSNFNTKSTYLVIEIAEAIARENNWKLVRRFIKKVEIPRIAMDHYIFSKRSDKVVLNNSSFKPFLRENHEFDKEPYVSEISIKDVKAEKNMGIFYSYSFTLKNSYYGATGTILPLFVYANRKDKSDYQIIGIADSDNLCNKEYSVLLEGEEYYIKGSISGREPRWKKRNVDFLPCVYILELNKPHPDIPTLIGVVNLYRTFHYIDKKDISGELSTDTKISQGYILVDEEGYIFLSEMETCKRYYFIDKKTGNKIKGKEYRYSDVSGYTGLRGCPQDMG